VITGVRRSGKSTILRQYKNFLVKTKGIPKHQVLMINFTDDANSSFTHHTLLKHIRNITRKNRKTYLFLDEIQMIDNFEQAVISLFNSGKYDIYITGSNSKMFSASLATLFTGRNIEIKVYPLSFAEYLPYAKKILKSNDKRSLFEKYLKYGGLPIILEVLDNDKAIEKILSTVFYDTVQKDIRFRYSIKRYDDFENFSKFVYENVGTIISTVNISNYIRSNNKTQIAHTTVERYLKWLEEASLIYRVRFFNIRGKKVLQKSSKYYSVDTGLRNAESKFVSSFRGALLENIVLIELLRRDYRVTIGTLRGKNEIDFVAEKNNVITYIQVADTIESIQTRNREYGNLKKIGDSNKKIVLSMQEQEGVDANGIESINLIN
jgi:predicted AAA+ superfamily ATPase